MNRLIHSLLILPLMTASVSLGNLVAYYQFEGNINDSSGRGHHGAQVGAPTYYVPGPAQRGQAAYFCGYNYATIPHHRQFDFTGDFSVCAWVRIDRSIGVWQAVAIKGPTGAWRLMTIGSGVFDLNGSHAFEIDGLNPHYINAAGVGNYPDLTDGQWHHLAGVRDGNALKLYADGQWCKTATPTGAASTNSDPIFIGGGAGYPNITSFFGAMDELRIYNHALTSSEVARLASRPDPDSAWQPVPADGQAYHDTPTLSWNPGITALSHDVYWATDAQAVAAAALLTGDTNRDNQVDLQDVSNCVACWLSLGNGACAPANLDDQPFVDLADWGLLADNWQLSGSPAYRGNQMTTELPLPPLQDGETYYWRVDEVNDAFPESPRTGPLWSFTAGPLNPVDAQVTPHNGSPTVCIDNTPDAVYAFLMHTGDFETNYQQMADAGIRYFTMNAGPENDTPYFQILNHQPQALMFPRFGAGSYPEWEAAHPDECVWFDDGSRGPHSMFSQVWLADASARVEDYCRHIRTAPFAEHVIGIHICSGYSAEWQSWGLWDNLRGDFSPAATTAWREYLTQRYTNDTALSAAWGQPVSLATVAVPTRARREVSSPFFRTGPDYQDIIDFYDFYWRGTTRAIKELAAAAKRGGGPNFLVGIFYGYQIIYGGMVQESQHLGMRELLDCPDIDFFCAPANYNSRGPGGTSTFMSFTESIQRHGKFWWEESDIRTHVALSDIGRAANLTESLDLLEREFAHVVTRKSGLWWFDMEGGWYSDPAILNLLQQQREFAENNPAQWDPSVEVAVFLDDKSTHRLAPNSSYLNNVSSFMAQLPRLGAPYHTYLLSDLPAAPAYKMYVFPLAFDLTDAERTAIESLKNADRSLLFFREAGIGKYDRGIVDHNLAYSQQLLGIDPSGSDWQSRDFGAWQLEWTRQANPPISQIRQAAQRAGVHLYHQQDDAFYAGNGLLSLHGQTSGTKTISFPAPVTVTELFTETPLIHGGVQLVFELAAKETRSFQVSPVP